MFLSRVRPQRQVDTQQVAAKWRWHQQVAVAVVLAPAKRHEA